MNEFRLYPSKICKHVGLKSKNKSLVPTVFYFLKTVFVFLIVKFSIWQQNAIMKITQFKILIKILFCIREKRTY